MVCGLWRSTNRLVAVVVDDDGRAAPGVFTAMDDEARWALLAHVDAVHGLDCALVVTDDLLKGKDHICRFAIERRHDLWAAPSALVDAIRHAAGLTTAPRIAAMIARLALVAGFRAHLRRVERHDQDFRQLTLL